MDRPQRPPQAGHLALRQGSGQAPAARAVLFLVLAVLAAAAATACSGGGSSPQTSPSPSAAPQGNLLVNPGLEDGAEPWITLAPASGFVRTEERAHSGAASALLKMRDPAGAEGAKVYYLVQEIKPSQFPDVVRGFYRVENWKKGTIRQYLQFVVIVFGPNPSEANNFQIRYILAGIDSPPFAIGNAFFVFLDTKEPAQDQWVPFEVNVKDDFQRLWGGVPKDYEKIRVLFEVRWDGKKAGDGAAEADVYYDDLYVGSASGS